jgi:hypothetical protein
MSSHFWDGRVFKDGSGHLHTPAGNQVTPAMQRVFEFGALSAVGLFPMLSREEMRAFNRVMPDHVPSGLPVDRARATIVLR